MILWGRTDGGFDAPPVYAVGSAPEANLGSSDISILLGSGDGKFRRLPKIRLGDPLGEVVPRPAAIAVGDFKADGALDLAIANSLPMNQVAIVLGKGDGTFRIAGSFSTGADPRSVLVADFAGDGKPGHRHRQRQSCFEPGFRRPVDSDGEWRRDIPAASELHRLSSSQRRCGRRRQATASWISSWRQTAQYLVVQPWPTLTASWT